MSAPVVIKTTHPLQRAGSYGLLFAALDYTETEADSVEELSYEEVLMVRDHLVSDVVKAGMTTKGQTDGWRDWWNILMGNYPNSPVIQPDRPTEREALHAQISAMFEEDDREQEFPYTCFYCDRPAQKRWLKSHLPLASPNIFNTSQDSQTGTPVCFGCRLSMWFLPYIAGHVGGRMTVVVSDAVGFERGFALHNYFLSRFLQNNGRDSSGLRPFQSVAVDILHQGSHHFADSPLVFWSLKNDNREANVYSLESVPHLSSFLVAIRQDDRAWRGYNILAKANAKKNEPHVGYDILNKSFFRMQDLSPWNQEDEFQKRVFWFVYKSLRKVSVSSLQDVLSLFKVYQKEVLSMRNDHAIDSIADLVVQWVGAEGKNPRGRFNEYMKSAQKSGDLNRFLTKVQYELYRDGYTTAVGKDNFQYLLDEGYPARQVLFFSVVEKLINSGVSIGTLAPDAEEEEIIITIDEQEGE